MSTAQMIAAEPASSGVSIEQFIPCADHGSRHEIFVRAPASMVFEAACNYDLKSHPLLCAIFWLREKLLRAEPAPPRRAMGLVAETMSLGWGVLGERPGRVMGAVTQPWKPNVVFRTIAAAEFAGFAEPDLLKIVWTIEAEPIEPALTRLRTETRAVATDAGARAKFDRYWRQFGIGIHTIRLFMLPGIRRAAERAYRSRDGHA